ncbi:hypothetical protein NA57DRAFT_56333 [Rhizodiscina lignyota]|uniref:Uncharacterized protein n=1 Tax=Rhizodiscina lignyota TaxID=1504668 RepID=A0A9P4II95_9PEZI|nr:hypothetical protein NA57DRAFT_56333 [Rhizodiscina lignyota]
MSNQVHICGVQPGSFTVAPGYAKGDSLGEPGCYREQDETLRWEDVEFVRNPTGIGVDIKFRLMKGHRNPYARNHRDGTKQFRLPPSKSLYEFDFSFVFFAIAFERGLFGSDLQTLYSGDGLFLRKNVEVNHQAIFLTPGANEKLDSNVPMLSSAVNAKLGQMCELVGIMGRNTIYSFRRTAIVEPRRFHGTELAKQVTGNSAQSHRIGDYDH